MPVKPGHRAGHHAQTHFTDEGSEQFKRDHPDVRFKALNVSEDGESTALYYRNTYEWSAAVITGSFEADVFSVSNMAYDWRALADKGFCADLSGSAIIREAVGRMHPSIQSELMRREQILGIPTSIQFDFLLVDDIGWAEAGYGESDVPKTFTALLDFLEGWVQRQERDPQPDIGVIASWAEEVYGPSSYIDWLSQLLLDSYIMQQQHAKEPLSFEGEHLPLLLERVKQVGAAIYRIEPQVTGPKQLIATSFGPGFMWPGRVSQRLISPRLNEDQPQLLPCTMHIMAVYGRSRRQPLATQLVEDFLTQRRWFIPLYPEYFYTDGQPVKNPRYAESLAHWTAKAAEAKARLASPDLSLGDRNQAQEELARFEGYLEDTKAREYSLSPEQLQDYKSLAPHLSFPMASPYVTWTDTGQNYETLRKRFVAGNLSASDFMQALRQMARLVILEEGN